VGSGSTAQTGRRAGKVNRHSMQNQLEQLEKDFGIEWQEFKIGEIFDIQNTFSFNKDKLTVGKQYDYVTRTSQNQGILQETGFVNQQNINSAGTWSLGLLQMDFFYRQKPWYAGQFVRKIVPKIKLSKSAILYFTVFLNKQKSNLLSGLVRDVDKAFLNAKVSLPIKNSLIAFDFIEQFIATLNAERLATLNAERLATLNAYLTTTNLKDYALTKDEQAALDGLDTVTLGTFSFHQLFDSIVQGRRLKKQDQVSGKMPFVMAGVTNTGVVDYIGNQVRIFPKNSLTVDIFGNVFYRSYEYGMGDDTGAYWNTDNHISKSAMLYLATTMQRFMVGKFDFGHKLRSSRSTDFKIQVPINPDKTPNYAYMSLVISAMQKIVIKNVVDYLDVRIEKTGHMVG
jgi:hypothetical protein